VHTLICLIAHCIQKLPPEAGLLAVSKCMALAFTCTESALQKLLF